MFKTLIHADKVVDHIEVFFVSIWALDDPGARCSSHRWPPSNLIDCLWGRYSINPINQIEWVMTGGGGYPQSRRKKLVNLVWPSIDGGSTTGVYVWYRATICKTLECGVWHNLTSTSSRQVSRRHLDVPHRYDRIDCRTRQTVYKDER